MALLWLGSLGFRLLRTYRGFSEFFGMANGSKSMARMDS